MHSSVRSVVAKPASTDAFWRRRGWDRLRGKAEATEEDGGASFVSSRAIGWLGCVDEC